MISDGNPAREAGRYERLLSRRVLVAAGGPLHETALLVDGSGVEILAELSWSASWFGDKAPDPGTDDGAVY